MIGAFRSELLKLWTRTYALGVAGACAFAVVTMLMSVGGAGETASNRGPAGLLLSAADLAAHDGLARSLGNAVVFVGITVLTVVAINTGGEHSGGTIRNLLVHQPHRVRLLLGKTLALLGYAAVVVVAASVTGAASAFLVAPGAGVPTSAWQTPDGVLAYAGGTTNLLLATWGWTAAGLVLAVVLRSAPAAIGVGVAYALPGEILLTEIVPAASTWVPGQVLQVLARGGGAGHHEPLLGYLDALVRSAGWTVLAIALAVAVFQVREVRD